MNKEPIGLYIFRFMLGLGLFAFMCMLYWSSVLIENDMQDLKSELVQIRNDINNLETKMEMHAINAAPSNPSSPAPSEATPKPNAISLRARPHMDAQYPNILQHDPFYQTVLPKLLGPNFKPKGILQTASIGKPNNLHPFSNWSQVSAWTDLCSASLSQLKFGIYETMAPELAIKMEARPMHDSDLPEFWVHLRENIFWEPLRQDYFSENIQLAPHFLKRHKVTSEDFKFYFDALMNPSMQEPGAVALRTYLSDIDSIEIIDDLTFVVRWKTVDVTDSEGKTTKKIKYVAKQLTGSLRPLASFVYKYFPDGQKIIEDDSDANTYLTNSVWAANFTQHWAKNIIPSCGAYIFEGMTEREIRFKRNPNYYQHLAALINEIEDHFKESPDNVWQDFQINQLDTYSLQPSQLKELDSFLKSPQYKEQDVEGSQVKRLDYFGNSFIFIGWNEAKPYFNSKKVRQALTMAIDRKRIIHQILNDQGVEITGPFALNSPAYDKSIQPWPFDLDAAKNLLEEEGWFDSNGDGMIDKEIDGKKTPFQFSLTYFVKNPTTKAICEYISTTLKEIGIQCSLNGVDIADLSAAFDEKSFDALCLGWSLGTPPEDPKQIWDSSGAKEKGSSNAIGFANEEVDKIIQKLQFESDQDKRIKLYHRLHAILHEEAPYTFLYCPKISLLYRSRVQNVFIPLDRQDLIPGANIAEPSSRIYWLKKSK